MKTSTFLPPTLLESLGGLDLIARRIVSGLGVGPHRSLVHGAGEEFFRHRSYQQGDDLRNLDWRVFARTDRLFVREFRSESDLQAYLVIDNTLSMGYADSSGMSKRRYAAFVAGALAYIMLRAGDQVGAISYGGAPLHIQPRNRPTQFGDLLRIFEREESRGRESGAEAMDLAGRSLRRRGRVILISDLLEEDDGGELLSALGRLRARGDEVIVLRPLTPAEMGEEKPDAGLFFDPERPDVVLPAAPARDAEFAGRVGEYFGRLSLRMREIGVEYVPMSTAEAVEVPLLRWLAIRRA